MSISTPKDKRPPLWHPWRASGDGTRVLPPRPPRTDPPYVPNPPATKPIRDRGLRRWVSVNYAAALIGVTPQTIRLYCRSGKLTARMVQPHWVIDPNSIAKVIEDFGDRLVNTEGWLTLGQAAEHIGISRAAVAMLCRDRRVRCVRASGPYRGPNRPWLIDPVSVENWRKQREG